MDIRLCSVRVSIHAGMTEMGAFGHSCTEQHGLHVIEVQTGELILPNLGCWGSPAIRYRTGNLIRHGGSSCACGRTFLILPGGVLGRVGDMLIVRGVSVYPSALANMLHCFPEVNVSLVKA